jgi:hypothetical protein
LSLIPNCNKPILYLVHTDSFVGPTVAIPDAFVDTPPIIGGPSNPIVDYIFLSLHQNKWASTWESFIQFQERQVKGPDGYESEDSCYKEGGDDDMYVEKVQAHQPPTRSAKRRIRKVDPQLCTSKQKGKEEVGYSIQVFIFSLSSITRCRHVSSP